MEVHIHLYSQSEPIKIKNALNAYQKGDLYCVIENESRIVHKFPIQHIFRIKEFPPPLSNNSSRIKN